MPGPLRRLHSDHCITPQIAHAAEVPLPEVFASIVRCTAFTVLLFGAIVTMQVAHAAEVPLPEVFASVVHCTAFTVLLFGAIVTMQVAQAAEVPLPDEDEDEAEGLQSPPAKTGDKTGGGVCLFNVCVYVCVCVCVCVLFVIVFCVVFVFLCAQIQEDVCMSCVFRCLYLSPNNSQACTHIYTHAHACHILHGCCGLKSF